MVNASIDRFVLGVLVFLDKVVYFSELVTSFLSFH